MSQSPGPAADLARCFGENVFAVRRGADLTQEELGFMAALHRTEISQLERGIRLARIDTLIKLSGALQVPPSDLLKGMAWTPRRVPPSGRFIVRVEAD